MEFLIAHYTAMNPTLTRENAIGLFFNKGINGTTGIFHFGERERELPVANGFGFARIVET